MGTVLVTGATGFVGGAVVERLLADSSISRVSIAVRQGHAMLGSTVLEHIVGDLGPSTEWTTALSGVEAVVHCAARVHVMRDAVADPLTEFRRVNVLGTVRLARQAAALGVRRFIFISSVKVNGEATSPSKPFTADAVPAPLDAYGISKDEAEQGLREVAEKTGMEVVIIRPTLVYGPGVKANFASMMHWLRKGVPLPFGAIDNRRSFVALGNLVDLIHLCLEHAAAANQTFLVSDDEDVSTTDLLQRMAVALGRPARLIPVSPRILELAAAFVGKKGVSQRLCGYLQVDIAKTKSLLGWKPPLTFDQGLEIAARGQK